jgi:alkaline phosphatase D
LRSPSATRRCAHVEVEDLEPGRDYFYRFIVGNEDSPVGCTRTLPTPGAPVDRLRFGVCGCQRYEDGLYTAFQHLAEEDLDFVFHYGDYIYEYRHFSPADRPAMVRDMPEPYDEIYTLDDYRNRYATYKANPLLQAAHQSAPFLMSWDDHEIDNN